MFIGYQHLAEEFERRLKAMQAAGEVPDLRNARVARLKADNAALRRRIAERDTEIIAMAAFKKRALSRLAAQQDEIEQLRAAVIQPKNLRLMHAEQTARTIGPYS